MSKLPIKWSNLWGIMFVLYFVYFAQGTLYKSGSFLSQSVIFVVVAVGLFCAVNMLATQNLRRIPLPLKMVLALFAILSIAYVVTPSDIYLRENHVRGTTMGQFKDQCAYLLCIFTGYIIGCKKKLPEYQMVITVVFLMALCVFMFITYYTSHITLFKSKDIGEYTNNAAYNFIYMLPFIALILKRQRLLAFACMGVVFVFVVIGVKRGAMMCLAVCLMYGLWWWKKNRGLSIKAIIVITLLVVAAVAYVQYTLETTSLLERRMRATAEGNTSNRDNIYSVLLNHWLYNSDIIHMIFGNGSAQTTKVAINYAHQDWLELLIDIGLLGVMVYAGIFISLFRFIKKCRVEPEIKLSLNLIVLIWFMKSMFSMGIESITGGWNMMLLGYLIANIAVGSRVNTNKVNVRQKNKYAGLITH